MTDQQDETSRILQANAKYAADFSTDKANLPMPPGRKLIILTCMDARIETGRLAGLVEGDAHVIRNAGGRVSDALRSLAISQQLLGTQEVLIIHHTDCGMLTFDDTVLRQKFRSQGVDADHIAFLPFHDVEQSVRDDLSLYKHSPLVRHDIPVRGFIYDVQTGKLNEVSGGK